MPKTKICCGCKKERSLRKFYKDKNRKDGRNYYCIDCSKLYNQRPYVKKRCRDAEYKRQLRKKYNMSLADYDQMLEFQNGVCVTCGKINKGGKRLAVDHNHKTGEIRGLLCQKCNQAIGLVGEDIRVLIKLAEYLNDKN